MNVILLYSYHIGFVCEDFSVGTKEGNADIFPERQVGLGEYAGEVRLSSKGITFPSGSNASANGTANQRRNRDVSGSFFVEPGR